MDTASKILATGGVMAIAAGLLLGIDLARRRQHSSAADVRVWFVAHTTALMQGAMLLGLSLAIPLSRLSDGLETLAAWLIVAGATFSTMAGIANGVQKVDDQFAARSLGLQLNTLQSIVLAAGVGILAVGVVRGL